MARDNQKKRRIPSSSGFWVPEMSIRWSWCFFHSKKQKEYLFWKFEKVRRLGATVTSDSKPIQRVHKHCFEGTNSFLFSFSKGKYERIYALKQFWEWLEKVPYHDDLPYQCSFASSGMALWFMDDGGLCFGSGMVIDLSNYSKEGHFARHAFL
jgi:LAGLIDADG DNA endonuclease family